jgi:hypothetical protein
LKNSKASIMKKLLSLLIISTTNLLAAATYAEGTQPDATLSRTTANLERFSLKPEASTDLGVGQYANALSGTRRWYNTQTATTLNVGLGIVFYDDAARFKQDVTLSGTNYTETRSSQVTSMLLEADYGWLKYFGEQQKNYWTLRGGYTLLPLAKRDIGSCIDCRKDRVDIKGGAYGVVGFGHLFGSTEVLIEYRHYATGDLNSGLRLGLGMGF